MMVANKHEDYSDDSRGIKRAEIVQKVHRQPYTPITPIDARRTPADRYNAIRDTPRPANSSNLSDEEYRYRLRQELQQTDRLVKPDAKPGDASPVVHLERGTHTIYLLEKRMHSHGGYTEVTYEAFPDGSGRLMVLDSGRNFNPIPFEISFEQLRRAYVAACEKRVQSQYTTPPEGA